MAMQEVLRSAKQMGLGYALYDGAALECRSASLSKLPRSPENVSKIQASSSLGLVSVM
jgi:hypothetical protein